MNANDTIKRKDYLDAVKFLAIFVIALTHFIDMFDPRYFSLWEEMPTSFLLNGVSGKLGVAVLGVLMCYFATNSKEENPIRYFFRRYAYFFVAGLLINIAYLLTGLSEVPFNLQYLLAVSFSLGDQIFPTFWCMRAFLAASCISYINGRFGAGVKTVLLELVILYFVAYDWTAVCLLGSLVALLLKNEKVKALFGKVYVKMIICILIFLMVKRPESRMTYYVDGIASMLFLTVGECSATLRKILGKCGPLSYLGKCTMPLFLLHPLVFSLVGTALFSTKYFYPGLWISFLLVFVICWGILIPSAILLQKALDLYNKQIARLTAGYTEERKE